MKKTPNVLETILNPKRKIIDSELQEEALADGALLSNSGFQMVGKEHPDQLMSNDQQAEFTRRSCNKFASLI